MGWFHGQAITKCWMLTLATLGDGPAVGQLPAWAHNWDLGQLANTEYTICMVQIISPCTSTERTKHTRAGEQDNCLGLLTPQENWGVSSWAFLLLLFRATQAERCCAFYRVAQIQCQLLHTNELLKFSNNPHQVCKILERFTTDAFISFRSLLQFVQCNSVDSLTHSRDHQRQFDVGSLHKTTHKSKAISWEVSQLQTQLVSRSYWKTALSGTGAFC